MLTMSLLLISCDDPTNYKQYVEEKFPEAIEIISVPDHQYRFLVVDRDSTIYYITALGDKKTPISKVEFLYSFK